MRRILFKTLTAMSIGVAALFLPLATSAQASGGDFGQHVRHCAQTMGFSGTHNPGMHHGFAGWSGETCQPLTAVAGD